MLAKRVVILGAGPGGLAAAHRLASHGIKTILLEKESHVGGLCRTIIHNGFRFDIGPHRWFTKNQEMNNWLYQLMGDELVEVSRKTGIYFDGKLFEYPLRASDVLRKAGPLICLGILFSYLYSRVASISRRPAAVTMEDAYQRQFGEKLYRMFFKAYSEKIWGSSCDRISSDWVDQRTLGLSVLQVIRDTVAKFSPRQAGLVEVTKFVHPRLGYGRISERMAEDIEENDGQILFNHTASSVIVRNQTVEAIRFHNEQNEVEHLETDHFLSSIPVTILIRILDPTPPAEILSAARALRFRDLITVHLILDQPQVMDQTWMYVNDKKIPFARIHEPKNFSPEMSPPGKTSLVAELFCSKNDEISSKNDTELSAMAIESLSSSFGFFQPAQVIDSFVRRFSHAYPVYDLGYRENLRKIQSYLSGITNLQIIGRGGTFHYHTSDTSIEMGMNAAVNLIKDYDPSQTVLSNKPKAHEWKS